MRTHTLSRFNKSTLVVLSFALTVLTAGRLYSQPATPPVPLPPTGTPVAVPAPVNPLAGLRWDSILKEMTTKEGQPLAEFTFSVTNSSDEPIVIDHVTTSCGCTVAKLPSQPWNLAPQSNGIISVAVNLAGKQGTFFKTVFVCSTNQQFKQDLNLKITMPESPAMQRSRNAQLALMDHQAVFKGDCARCHAEPTKNLLGKELFAKACGICHEANPRDSKVPDLHNFFHPNDVAYWKLMIANGKPSTMMPGFSTKNGGPLSDDQVDSLAQVCSTAFLSAPAPAPVPPAPMPPGVPPVPGSH